MFAPVTVSAQGVIAALGSRCLRRRAVQDKLCGIANADALSTLIHPHRRQAPVRGRVEGDPLTLDDVLDAVGIGEKADCGANSKWRLTRWHDRHDVASRRTAASDELPTTSVRPRSRKPLGARDSLRQQMLVPFRRLDGVV